MTTTRSINLDTADASDLAAILPSIDLPADGVLAYNAITNSLRICSKLAKTDAEVIVATFDGIWSQFDSDNPDAEELLAVAEVMLRDDVPEAVARASEIITKTSVLGVDVDGREAYVQDVFTMNDRGEEVMLDVVDVIHFDLDPDLDADDVVDAARTAARDAGYLVGETPDGMNGDLGPAFEVARLS